MSNFAIQAYLSYRALFLYLDWKSYAPNVFLAPALLVVMTAFAGRFAVDREAGDFYLKGMAMVSMLTIVLQGIIMCYFGERVFGTLPVLFSSASNRIMMYWSRGLLHFPNGILVEVGWEKWTPKLDKLERRRCQDEAGPARKVYQGIPAGSSEAGIGRESVIARGRASVVLSAIDVGVLGEAM